MTFNTLPGSGVLTFSFGWRLAFIIGSSLLIIGCIAVKDGFRPYNFYWGDYSTIFNYRRSIAKFVIGTVIVGILLSVLGGLITNFLTVK